MRPGEQPQRWDGESVTVQLLVIVFRDELPDQIEDAQEAINHAEQIVREKLSGMEYEIERSEAD